MSSDRFPDRLRRGDATALLELAHATYGRALAVARAEGWPDDPEALLLDAYVALWLRRADAPDALTEQWALTEVLAYGAERSAARERARRRRPGVVERAGAWSAARLAAGARAVRGVVAWARGAARGAAAVPGTAGSAGC